MDIRQQLETLQTQALQELEGYTDPTQLTEWHRIYLGKKGQLTGLLKQLGGLSAEERPLVGQQLNQVKELLTIGLEQRQNHLEEQRIQQQLAKESLDVTLPGRPHERGSLHVSTQTLRKIYRIFTGMGFQVYDSPEVETDENNFQLLNIPEYHPARDMWDTFWVDDKVVLRTHTSPGQIRVMKESYPNPIRVILPGKVYRYEQVTPRSEHQFYQVEGLTVGHQVRMTDLIGVITEFTRQMYGSERKVRIRGSYFPFTEPSIEIDMDCILCAGKGCRVCKYTNWLEVGGAGMVHPTVLRNGGYDPEEWSGFAFGMGVERPAMLQHGIHDIRHFYTNDLNFLKQF